MNFSLDQTLHHTLSRLHALPSICFDRKASSGFYQTAQKNKRRHVRMQSHAIPRWQEAIEQALQKDSGSNAYQLATIEASGPGSLSPVVPHVRSVIHRAFLAPTSPSRPLLLTSTDIRTPKARQIAEESAVELAWWIAPTQEQFRISGRAYILPAPNFAGGAAQVATLQVAHDLHAGERLPIDTVVKKLKDEFRKAKLGEEGFDWDAKRVEMFDGMSGHMKASWVRPVPGTPLEGGYDAGKAWPESLPRLGEAQGDELKQVQEALKNFALVVIDPMKVDYVELGVVPNRRTHFFKDKEGVWEEEPVVP